MTPEQVSGEMVEAVRMHFEMRSDVDVPIDIPEMLAAAINASGCVLVPREPTPRMLGEISAVLPDLLGAKHSYPLATHILAEGYRAMLAAAPTPASSERESDHD